MGTYLNKLSDKLIELRALKDKFLSTIEIYYHDPINDNPNILFLTAHVNHWGSKKENHEIYQIELIKQFNDFLEYLTLIEPLLPQKKLTELKKTTNLIWYWIEEKQSAPGPNLESSIKRFNSELERYAEVIKLLNFTEVASEKILVPDTNALISHPELSDYALVFPSKINIVIPPTVISELDKLKVNHKSEDIKNKVRSIISHLKGYRNQGDIINAGIVIAKTINLKMIATEPKFDKSLSWLDPNNMDDRIIVTILDVEIHNLSNEVILITNDLNMQNKALLAGIKYLDTDEIFK